MNLTRQTFNHKDIEAWRVAQDCQISRSPWGLGFGPFLAIDYGTQYLGVPKWDPNFGNYPDEVPDSKGIRRSQNRFRDGSSGIPFRKMSYSLNSLKGLLSRGDRVMWV